MPNSSSQIVEASQDLAYVASIHPSLSTNSPTSTTKLSERG
uniref:Uncharacterized protein n=1 Tax=Arundo donax TaxID=35708 RepID=A0A0A9BGR5_ARUDO